MKKRNVFILSILFFLSCTRTEKNNMFSGVELKKEFLSKEISNFKIKNAIYNYIDLQNKSGNPFQVYLVYIGCDNKRISIIITPTRSKFEIYSSPFCCFSKYKNNLILFYSPNSSIFAEDTINTRKILNEIVHQKNLRLTNDIDENLKRVPENDSEAPGHRYPARFIYFHNKDSLVTEMPYKGFESNFFEVLPDSIKFHYKE